MAGAGRRIVYMNVPATRPEKDESFEERRFNDYLRAYQTTGRPPPPCPPTPTDPAQRAALGLPPLWEPLIEAEGLTNGVEVATPSSVSATTSTALPNFSAQAFTPTKVQEYGSEAYFYSIVAQPEYGKYSFEELRLEAYKAGKKFADVPKVPAQMPQRPALLAAPSISTGGSDSLQSINSMPPYDQHSFEELRLAFIRAGRPLTSPEIVAQNAVLRLTV
ncbi:hypothetical protein PYCCODRAFT_1376989 [Trametes coccinea BRFM310]|uniref:Uncharacterized protein n=1 Tax=Trametes coccinea (strain BRFM310) TaxID=1353009 RepID=A0A1Y2I903_TRAC3|nr:hypothetical protein PYCCODRAFT_1376989 [Trametes coccinea BRFM310]